MSSAVVRPALRRAPRDSAPWAGERMLPVLVRWLRRSASGWLECPRSSQVVRGRLHLYVPVIDNAYELSRGDAVIGRLHPEMVGDAVQQGVGGVSGACARAPRYPYSSLGSSPSKSKN